jgi:hypothetical protein
LPVVPARPGRAVPSAAGVLEGRVTALQSCLLRALTREWQDTHTLRNAVSTRANRPAMGDVSHALRFLRRAGHAERQSRGTDGHAWRRATTPETT